MIICLDAGHGGIDSGAIGDKYRTYEKDINLAITKHIKALLEKRWQIKMTRDDDTFLKLRERVIIANKAHADVFVSVHCNSFTGTPSNMPAGIETYCYRKGTKAEKLATAIHNHVLELVDVPSRGVKAANYTVLANTSMPAALIECLFIRNPMEEEMLRNKIYQQRIATGIANGIVEFVLSTED